MQLKFTIDEVKLLQILLIAERIQVHSIIQRNRQFSIRNSHAEKAEKELLICAIHDAKIIDSLILQLEIYEKKLLRRIEKNA